MVLLIGFRRSTQSFGEANPLTVDLPLLINTASVFGLGSRTYLIDELLFSLGIKIARPCKPAYFFHYEMLEFYDTLIILYHNYRSSNSSNFASPSSITIYDGLLSSLGMEGDPGFMILIFPS